MKTWLITWNEENWNWKDYSSICEKTANGEKINEPWTFANTHVETGDRIFLIKIGQSPKGIVASGYAKSSIYKTTSYDSTKNKETNHIDVEFDRILNYKTETILEQTTLREMFPDQEWSPQSSGIAIKEKYNSKLEEQWLNLIKSQNQGDKMNFSWIPFYEELADKILEYKNNRPLLIDKIREVHKIAHKEFPKIESDNNNIPDIDPFTVFALFNRGKMSNNSRQQICKGFKQVFEITADIPNDFDGIPVFTFNQYCFYRYLEDEKRNNDCFDILWNLFEEAIKYSNNSNNTTEFVSAFDKALSLDLIRLAKLTMGLFQIRPNTFINIDSRMITYFNNHLDDYENIDNATQYLKFNQHIYNNLLNSFNCNSLAELSYKAFLESNQTIQNESVKESIRKIIELYKHDFDRINEQEIYKWKAIAHYKKVWNINAPDFETMITNAFSKADNLLTASRYFAFGMLKDFAKSNPEQLRDSFKNLYNEELNIEDRINNFISKYDAIAKSQNKNSFQNLHTISVYLSFQFPEKYYIYKSKIYKNFRDMVGFKESVKNNSISNKFNNNSELLNLILDEIYSDTELQELSKSRLTDECYQDNNFHLLALDIAYFGSYQDRSILDCECIPSLDKYNPNITKQMWIEILNNKEITNNNVKTILNFMLNNDGECTCSTLAKNLGNSAQHYIDVITDFGKNIHKKYNINLFDNQGNYYAIPFIGKFVKEDDNNLFSWTLRSELKEALEGMGSNIKANNGNDSTTALEEIIAAFKDLGGKSRLNDLYKQIEERAKLPALNNAQDYQASIRNEIYRHSSDCDAYVPGNQDIFISIGGKRSGVWGLRNMVNNQTDKKLFDSNIILYGPPGTGKTYNTVNYAVAIIENKSIETIQDERKTNPDAVLKRYNDYKNQELIEFTTFHQSYGYEEFIEGIKPEMTKDEDENITYKVKPGVFKEFCEKAQRPINKNTKNNLGFNENPTVWKVSLEGTYENPTRTECIKNGHIRIGFDEYGENLADIEVFEHGGKAILDAFYNKMRIGDIVMSCYNATTIDAIGVITGDCEWHDEYSKYKRVRKVNWLVKNIKEDIFKINNETNLTLSTVYKLNISLENVVKIIEKHSSYQSDTKKNDKNYVFIIDEINRGNISKIFGELITLIEESKRKGAKEETSAKLPYSGQDFSVPDNVYILGTMNTADRSIAAIDTALRRRFSFKEMLPDTSILSGIEVEGLDIAKMLETMNKKITALYDREHTIGHSYFLPLKENDTIDNLANIFENNIIPLLQEYFFEDYEKIQLVLGDNFKDKKDKEHKFIIDEQPFANLFGSKYSDNFPDDFVSYEINKKALYNIETYKSICQTGEKAKRIPGEKNE